MRLRQRHIIQGWLLTLFLLFTSCYEVELLSDATKGDDKVQIELFSRATAYNRPVTRASANENTIAEKPWVLVFKGTDENATFVEAVQAVVMNGKRYVVLTKQSDACRLLLLANYDYTAETVPLSDKTLSEACSLLKTAPLEGNQTAIPYVGASIPMSYLLDLGGINEATKIGSSATPLSLIRSVAKVVVKNTADNFTFLGVTEVDNVPKQGQLYNLTSTPMTGASLINYLKSDGSNIADASNNTIAANPIYLYESHIDNNSFVVIKGTYMGVDYYYKMAFVDNTALHNKMHLLRNYVYTFTITQVTGEGHLTAEAARNAPAFNNDKVHAELTVTDASAYETTAFDTYYLSVSNSHYISYNKTDDLVAFSLLAENKGTETLGGEIVMPKGLTLVSPSSKIFSVGVNENYPQEVKLTMDSDFKEGVITLKFGNLKKLITVKNMGSITAETTLKVKEDLGYYCLSGVVDGATPPSWITLRPSSYTSGDDRNDTKNIVVDDGIINIFVGTGTGTGTATIYLSTIKDPATAAPIEYTASRVKIDITQ